MKKIKLVCNQQIGDCIRCTTVAKLIKEQYSEYEIMPIMSHPCVFDNNPHTINSFEKKVFNTASDKEKKALRVVCNQDDEKGKIDNKMSIHKLKENDATMVDAMIGYINGKYGFKIKVTDQFPDLYLSDEEKKVRVAGRYFVVNCGSEYDNTRKQYPTQYWQEIFDGLPDVRFVQVGMSKDNHETFENKNVINGLDKYNIRRTMGLVYNSEGIISPYSFLAHVGAGLRKPAIVLGGGGEDISWENYDYKHYNLLHTIGSFECCRAGGCWVSDCKNKDEEGDNKCMKLIKPKLIIDIIKSIWKH